MQLNLDRDANEHTSIPWHVKLDVMSHHHKHPAKITEEMIPVSDHAHVAYLAILLHLPTSNNSWE